MLKIGVVGEFQSGKSLLINCLLKRTVATVGNRTATTHTIVHYRYSDSEYIVVVNSRGENEIVTIESLTNLDTRTDIQEIYVHICNSFLKERELIDMPGLGNNQEDNAIARRAVASIDFAILVGTNSKEIRPSSSSMCDILLLKEFNIPYYFILNCSISSGDKWDPTDEANHVIAKKDYSMISFYRPMSFPFELGFVPIVNLIWYWYSIMGINNNLSQKYLHRFKEYGLFDAEVNTNDVKTASNFYLIERMIGSDNDLYLTLKKEFREEFNALKNELCPIGTIQAFAFKAIPRGWLLCDGASISIDSYPELYSMLGNTFGESDDGFFKIPDLRGRFIRGWDNERVIENIERKFGSYQNDSIQKHTHIIPAHKAKEDGSHTHRVYFDRRQVRDTSTFSSDTEVRIVPITHLESDPIGANPGTTIDGVHSHTISQFKSEGINNDDSVHSDLETRPYNIALLYCIKAENLTQRGQMHEDMKPIVDAPSYQVMNNNSSISYSLSQDHHMSFKEVSHFSEGRVRCLDNDGWVFITPYKKYINHYEDARDFSEKRAAIKVDGKWGFIDYDEKTVIPCIYSRVGDFSEGVAYYEKPLEPGGKYTIERGFINYEGAQVLSLTENYSGYGLEFDNKFNYGLFKIYSRVHAEWINHEGKIVNKYQGKGYDGSNQDFSVRFNNISDWFAYGELSIRKVVYYSPQNEEEEKMSSDFFGAFTEYDTINLRFDVKRNIIETYEGHSQSKESEVPEIARELSKQYSAICPFVSTKVDGTTYKRARVRKNGFWGFIDELGREIIPCVFNDVGNYSEGYAAISKDGKWFFIDIQGKPICF